MEFLNALRFAICWMILFNILLTGISLFGPFFFFLLKYYFLSVRIWFIVRRKVHVLTLFVSIKVFKISNALLLICLNASVTIYLLLGSLMMVSSLMQRPLKTIARTSGDVYIPRGVSVPALDKDVLWEFQPKKLGNPIKVTIFFMYLKVVLQTLYLNLFFITKLYLTSPSCF